MEELLNKLIEKGWKPRGLNIMGKIKIDYDIEFAFDIYDSLQKGHWNFRELVSKESGLWQFCCKNRLTNRDGDWSKNAERDEDGVIDRDCLIFSSDYEYWLIESSLKDESELENFLLSNIKIDGTTK